MAEKTGPDTEILLPSDDGARFDGKYRLESVIAQGGMGVVYRAVDAEGNKLAVKLIRSERERSDEDRSRFSLEAHTTRALRHPHIVRVVDSGEDNEGRKYLAMELLEGMSLQQSLALRGRLPCAEALSLLLPIVGALAWAHDLGVLHRDIKPSNIFLSQADGGALVPKLLDFGMAKVRGHVQVTRPGQVIGTVGYMAPEQASGLTPTPATDVWALGAVFFRCLAGAEAYDGNTEAKVLMQVVTGRARRLRSLEPSIPRTLANTVERALEADPGRRYRDVRGFARALVSACAADGITLPRDVDPIGLPDWTRWLEQAQHADATSLELPTIDTVAHRLRSDTGDDFVGRRELLSRLEERIERTQHGHGGVVLVSGDAGMGKSRVLGELALRAAHKSVRVHAAFCAEAEASPPFWAWIQLLRAARDSALNSGQTSETPPEVQALLEGKESSRTESPAQRNAQAERLRFFDLVCAFLEERSGSKPLVLIIDDCQWADPGSLSLLRFAAKRLLRSHVLVVVAYRGEGHGSNDELDRLRTLSDCDHHELSGMSTHEVRELCLRVSGNMPSDTTLGQLMTRSEGNPLFVKELSRASGFGSDLRTALPAVIREAIAQRLQGCPPDVHALLECAAVLGTQFDLASLVYLKEQPAALLLDLLSEAEQARLLVKVAGTGVRFRFSHALIQEVLYAGLRASRRAQLHDSAVRCIEAQRAGEPDALSLLAHHAVRAAPMGNVARAVELALRAGRYARARYAYEQALAHFLEGIEALDLAPASVEFAGQRARLFAQVGDAQLRCGQRDKARAAYEKAADLAESAGSVELLAQAALGFSGESSLHPTIDVPGVAMLERALARMGRDESPVRARLLARLAVLSYGGNNPEKVEQWSQEAERIATASGDTLAIIAALFARTLVLGESPRVEERLALSSRMLAAAVHNRDAEVEIQARRYRACDFLRLGQLSECEEEVRVSAEAGERFKNPFFLWNAVQTRATLHMVRGQLSEAEVVAAEARELGKSFMPEVAITAFGAQMYPVYRLQARWPELELVVLEHLSALPEPVLRAYRGSLELDQARLTKAREDLLWLTENDLARVSRDWFRMPMLARLSELCTGLGDAERARRVYTEFSPYQGQLFTVGGTVCEGSLDRFLGMLAETFGDFERAFAHYETALAFNERLSATPWLARTRKNYALALRKHGGERERERAEALERMVHDAIRRNGWVGIVDARPA